jgi:hypothetical protein
VAYLQLAPVRTRPGVSGYSGTPLAQKLGIKAGCRLCVQSGPPNYPQLLAPLPGPVHAVMRVSATTDIIHVFATKRTQLARVLKSTLSKMRPDAVLWVSWPKKASGVATDITEDTIRALALPLGLVDVKVCAVDDTWSGLKLVVRRSARASGAKPTAGAQ